MATHLPVVGGHPSGFGATMRNDKWWVGPAVTFAVFTTFIVYTTWALFQGKNYLVGPYLSPYYSPVLLTDPTQPFSAPESHAWFGTFPSWWPSKLIPASPAALILIFPAGFRFTCYYYRKAYYRSFAGSPPGCAVGPMAQKRKYNGETKLLLIQNLHRYFLYFALLFIVLLGWDAVKSFHLEGEGWGIGVGSIMITVNVCLIAAYTFGCHSFRHLIGGGKDCMSCGNNTLSYTAWKRATWFNERHMQFAWLSLVWVMLTDLYIRLVAMGHITDLNTWT